MIMQESLPGGFTSCPKLSTINGNNLSLCAGFRTAYVFQNHSKGKIYLPTSPTTDVQQKENRNRENKATKIKN